MKLNAEFQAVHMRCHSEDSAQGQIGGQNGDGPQHAQPLGEITAPTRRGRLSRSHWRPVELCGGTFSNHLAQHEREPPHDDFRRPDYNQWSAHDDRRRSYDYDFRMMTGPVVTVPSAFCSNPSGSSQEGNAANPKQGGFKFSLHRFRWRGCVKGAGFSMGCNPTNHLRQRPAEQAGEINPGRGATAAIP